MNDPFSICIILVAKDSVYDTHGYQPYIDRFKKQLELKYRKIYLCSRGDRKIGIAIDVQRKLLELYPSLLSSKPLIYNIDFKGRHTQAVTIALDASRLLRDKQQRNNV